MIEIIIAACLAKAPMICRDHSLTFSDVPLLQCVYAGQSRVAEWANEHPKWTVKKWKCQQAGMWAKT